MKKLNVYGVFLVGLFALAGVGVLVSAHEAFAAQTQDCQDEASYPLISKADLKKLAEKKTAFIVDVNSQESFDKIHVPGAVHFGSHKKDFETLLPKDKNTTIVAYCGGVTCGAWHQAAERACKLGYTHVLHFKEGIKGWAQN